MSMQELVGRLAVLGLPPEVMGGLTLRQLQGLFMTLAEYFAASAQGQETDGPPTTTTG